MDPSIRHKRRDTIQEERERKARGTRHYSRGTRLHKQTFEALVRFKRKSLEKDFQLNFTSKVKELREETTHANLLAFCNDENFK